MSSADGIEFLQSLLITTFLTCLYTLIPKLLEVLSAFTAKYHPQSFSFFENLHRHNPIVQWLAERRIFGNVLNRRYEILEPGNQHSQNAREWENYICPTYRWLRIIFVFVLVYFLADLLGALTILTQVTVPSEPFSSRIAIPAFPVNGSGGTIQNLNKRGNCMWTQAEGSGAPDSTGFILFQLCADVFLTEQPLDTLLNNEIRVEGLGYEGKAVLNLETITSDHFKEDWRVSADNDLFLKDANGLRLDYMANCGAECQAVNNSQGLENAIIFQILQDVKLVQRELLNYNTQEVFDPTIHLLKNRTRLSSEALASMVSVVAMTFFWNVIDLSRDLKETDYGILVRLIREKSQDGGCSVETVLNAHVDETHRFVRKQLIQNIILADELDSSSSILDDKNLAVDIVQRRLNAGKSQIIVEDLQKCEDCEENSVNVLFRRDVAHYTYGLPRAEEARDGLAIPIDQGEDERDQNVSSTKVCVMNDM